jgi:exonuclease SbcD
MKILHTSDWHLGKELMNVSFHEDMSRFFDWLIETIQQHEVDVLLMSGDLFDQANPSQQALRQYYDFLKKMIPLNCRIILTGGNHDSPAVLNAPRELLNALDVVVVGGAPKELDSLFVPVKKNNQELVVAAVPYLRDKDIRQSIPGESYHDKVEMTKLGLQAYFGQVNAHYTAHYMGVPFILMAHLYAQGAHVSESEREIQVGNLAGVEASTFGKEPHYVALGHIHKPQQVQFPHIRYSGSPIPLSFSEKEDRKQVVLLEWKEGQFEQKVLHMPVFRRLLAFEGTFEEVKAQVEHYESKTALEDLCELRIREQFHSQSTLDALEAFMSEPEKDGFRLLKASAVFENDRGNLSSTLNDSQEIEHLSPEEIFEKRLDVEANLENREELVLAFKELMQALNETSEYR